jgi:diguanylate cyclase (GGDEF)-like protein
MPRVFRLSLLWPILFLFHFLASAVVGQTNGQGTPPATLTRVQQVVALNNTEAAKSIPVQLEATVTYVLPTGHNFFVQDGGFGSYVLFDSDIGLLPGDRVAITGVTEASFRPEIVSRQVRFVAHGTLPAPKPAKFEDLIDARLDSQFVQLEGRVLSATREGSKSTDGLRIHIGMEKGTVEGIIGRPDKLQPEYLLDADIRLTGVAGGEFDSRGQLAGVALSINSAQQVTILHPRESDPWGLPAVPMENVISAYRSNNASQRVRITGTLTYFEPGTLAVVENHGVGILVETRSHVPLHAGAGVEVIGFPGIDQESVRLENGQIRPFAQSELAQPSNILWDHASLGEYAYSLVSMEGEVVAVVPDNRADLLILRSEGHLYSATLRHRSSEVGTDSDQILPLPTEGSRVRVTGVCFVDTDNHWHDRLWFDLRMRSMDDIVVLSYPNWWTTRRLGYLTTALSIVILFAVIWAGLLDRRLRQQNEILARQSQEDAIRERRLARIESHRSHILELISSSEPLQEVLQEIAAMVSSRLFGASCWFELHIEGDTSAALERPSGPSIVYQELFAPDGTRLGMLLATPQLRSSLDTEIASALTAGARLAELAIDTRRLYTDLRHRSEFDLLTDLPNRFSLEKHLDVLMLGAETESAIFGLIYVDLDRFKEINDRYGHRTGDLYLQAATGRMKFQLRGGDILARIGGDEFIALVPILHSRSDAEEIAMRLERCFDEPFEVDGIKFLGSASVGLAVYPEDGATKEDLQRSADAAMYANKEGKRHQEKLAEAMQRALSEDLLQ